MEELTKEEQKRIFHLLTSKNNDDILLGFSILHTSKVPIHQVKISINNRIFPFAFFVRDRANDHYYDWLYGNNKYWRDHIDILFDLRNYGYRV